MIRDSRLTALERMAEPEREVLRQNRKILLSAIPEIMEKLRVTEAEAWRMLPQVCAPEVAALAADDWETNPLTLDLLKILGEPNGNRKIIEKGLQCAADTAGVSSDAMLFLVCLNPDVSLECKLEHVRIAKERGLPGVIVMFSEMESDYTETVM